MTRYRVLTDPKEKIKKGDEWCWPSFGVWHALGLLHAFRLDGYIYRRPVLEKKAMKDHLCAQCGHFHEGVSKNHIVPLVERKRGKK